MVGDFDDGVAHAIDNEGIVARAAVHRVAASEGRGVVRIAAAVQKVQADARTKKQREVLRSVGNLLTTLSELTLTSPMSGWTVEVYVAENEPSLRKDLRGWGDIVTSGTATTTDKHRFDLGQHQGRYVLVWITKLAGDGQLRAGNYGVTWLEAELRA